ncbi:amidohydrolase family protein [Pseudonocardia sp. RS010]|uniref:amidohydrolase family protein n=1 Tax=Pseudonocardia sp. RS010 TaxID=3385979 RepID=UPI0039A1C94D
MTIDLCVYCDWQVQAEFTEYLPRAWQEYVGTRGSMPWNLGERDVRVLSPWHHPLEPSGLPPDFAELAGRVAVDGTGRALLAHRAGVLFAADPNAYVSLELCAASNRWVAERWLAPAGSPFVGGMVIQSQMPEEAAAEIRRSAATGRFVAVHMGGNGLGKPYGHPIYHPIYRAACDVGLPLVIHSTGDSANETISHSTAGGLSSFAAEYRALAGQSLMNHITSLIGQGVFESYPDLQVLVVGGGLAWIPSLLWRFEVNYGAYGRDAPWVRKSPIDYFLEHFHVGSYRIDRPADPASLHAALRTIPALENVICYASGMPEPDADTVADATRLLPESWHRAVFTDNASALLGDRVTAGSR